MRRSTALLVFLLVAGLGGAAYWFYLRPLQNPASAPAQAASAPAAIPVIVVPAKIDVLVRSIEAVGTLRSNESVVITSEIAGRVAQILVSEGQRVTKGTPILTLDDSIYKAELAQAQAALKLSQANNNRATELLERRVGTVRTRDEALASLRANEASMELSQARLDKTRIVAPFDGVLGLRRISLGTFVNAGQELINLEAIDPLKFDFRVPEIYLPQVRVNQTVEIETDSVPGKIFQGTVYAIDPLVDVNGRSIVIRGRIPNPGDTLRPGVFARVKLILERKPDTLFIPETAIVPIRDEKFVFRVVDSKATLVKIRIGERRGTEVAVLEGLKPGDQVVTDGQIRLRDGATVKILPPRLPAQS